MSVAFSTQTITPAQAEKWLESRHDNRTVRRVAVQRLVDQMKAGSFVLTHQGIAFDPDHRLIDGEHRLRAVVESGTAQTMVVATYTDPDMAMAARLAFDSGAKRSLGEQMEIMSILPDRGTDRIAVARMIQLIESGNIENARDEREIAIEFVPHHTAICALLSRDIKQASHKAALVWVRPIAPSAIDTLVAKVVTAVGLNQSEAVLLGLLKTTMSRGGTERLAHSLKIIRLVEACLNGEAISKAQEQTRATLIERLSARKLEVQR